MSDGVDLCFHRCNGCGHVHRGRRSNYKCSEIGCRCADRYEGLKERAR